MMASGKTWHSVRRKHSKFNFKLTKLIPVSSRSSLPEAGKAFLMLIEWHIVRAYMLFTRKRLSTINATNTQPAH